MKRMTLLVAVGLTLAMFSTPTLVEAKVTCTIKGTSGNDVLNGTAGADVICGGKGNDTINGKGGTDVLIGGPGDDGLFGGTGNDVAKGGTGSDYLSDQQGVDKLLSGDGSDFCLHAKDSHGGDTLNGGAGTERYVADASDTKISVEKSVITCPIWTP
jgi:Ca2+-binding RTX toxin-like protein